MRRRTNRLHLVQLEERDVPATLFVVNSALDSSNLANTFLTLREALLVERGDVALSSLTAVAQQQVQLNDPVLTEDTIQFSPTLAGKTITFTSSDTSSVNQFGATGFVVTTTLAINGAADGSGPGVTISGGGTERLFAVTATGNLTLSNLTLTGGLAQGGSGYAGGGGAAGLGGAVFVDQGKLLISGSTLTDNKAAGGEAIAYGSGGGGGGLLTSSTSSSGGGPNGGATGKSGGFGGGGGGISVTGSSESYQGGSGGFGGGGGSGVEVEVNGADYTYYFSGGSGGFGGGGGFGDETGTKGFGGGAGGTSNSNSYGGTGGGGAGLGGAVFNDDGTVTVADSTLTANSAIGGQGAYDGDGFGGAVFSRNGILTIESSTLSANTAVNGGTDVYVLADNVSGGGGDTANSGKATLTLTDSILGQTANSVSDVVTSTNGTGAVVTASGSYNLIRSTSVFGVGNISTSDPQLGSLQNNGGPTETMAPLAGSPAIDAGPASDPNGLLTDQRGPGYTRVVNGAEDVGAVENQNTTVTVGPSTLPDGQVGLTYSQSLSATGPASSYTFAVTAGTLPAGLTLSSAGVLSGTPTTTQTSAFTITTTGTDGSQGSQAYVVVIAAPVVVGPSTLPAGEVGQAYNQTFTASGQPGAYTFAVTAGALPAGLSLSSSGLLSGVPTASGAASFTITATAADGYTGSQAYQLEVYPVGNEFIVTSLADDGSSGTLRSVIAEVNADQSASTDTITFAVEGTISLTSGQLEVFRTSGPVIIDGTGQSIVINAESRSSVFQVDAGVTATLTSLTLTDGDASVSGGAILSAGTLMLNECDLSDNTASFRGGGIESTGALTVSDSTFSGNISESDGGGGIDNRGGSLTVTGSTFTGNSAYYGGAIYTTTVVGISTSSFLDNDASYYGGAIDVAYTTTLTVSDSTFEGNEAGEDGGGINTDGAVTIQDSTISGNSVELDVAASGGGGISDSARGSYHVIDSTIANNTSPQNGGGIQSLGTVSVQGSTISGNTSDSSSSLGGGIDSSGTLTIANSNFSDNTSDYRGGAIYNTGLLNLDTSTLTGNSAPDDSGGGVYNLNGTMTVNDSTFAANTAEFGGGIATRGSILLEVTNSTFSNNIASWYGGGIDAAEPVTVITSTFTDNTAEIYGGGINSDDPVIVQDSTLIGNSVQASNGNGGALRTSSYGSLTVTDSTIIGNSATSAGGGIENEGPLTLSGSIVTDNLLSAGDGSDPDIDYPISTDDGYNLLGSALAGIDLGTGDIFTNAPDVAPLANNGGPTETMALQSGSPAINANNPSDQSNDQRGVSVQDGRRDIGAFEYEGAYLQTTITTVNTVSVVSSTSTQSVSLSSTVASSGLPVTGGTVTFTITDGNGDVVGSSVTSGTVVGGTTSATYTLPANISAGTYEIAAVYSGTDDFAESSAAAVLTVEAATTITTNPVSQTIDAGTNTNFTASASSDPTPTVQWQVSTNGGSTFTYLSNGSIYSGVTNNTLIITDASASLNGDEYQAVFSNTLVGSSSPSTATTTAATLAVDTVPVVTTNPASQTIDAGSTVNFTAAASGNPSPSVQWQISSNGGSTFTNLSNGGIYSGVTSNTLTITGASASLNGDEYQAVFSNTPVGAATTTTATLTVETASTITANPTSQTINADANVSFTAAASGNPTPTVQWQVSTNNGSTFINLSDGGVYSGVTSEALTITNVSSSLNNDEYRAVFSSAIVGDTITATTTAAKLTVDTAPVVITNPMSQAVASGGDVSFTALATSNPEPSVQWQMSLDGGVTFTNLANTSVFGGVTSDTLTVTDMLLNGAQFRAVFSNTLVGGTSPITATSTAAMLTTDSAPIVTSNPTSEAISLGGNAAFTAAAQGNPAPTVQWQVSTNDGSTFTNLSDGGVYSGATSNTLDITNATAAIDGDEYRAVFSNMLAGAASFSTATTTAATLTESLPVDPATSALSLSVPTVQSGTSITLTLQAKDSNDDDITTGGATVAFALGNTTGGQGTFGAVTDNGNGTYTASFTGTFVGTNTITGTINGTPVTSIQPITVTPGVVSLANSIVTLVSHSVQAGNSDLVTFTPRDAFGNAITTGGLTVVFGLGSGAGQGTFGIVIDDGNGTYTAPFTGTIVGTNTITAAINGQAVTTAAAMVSVSPGAVDPANSLVFLTSPEIQLGGTDSITVQSRDAFGNDVDTNNFNVAFALENNTGAKGTFSKVKNNENGTYTASFTGTTDGNNILDASVNGVKVSSTATVTVVGGAFSASESTVKLGSSTIVAGTSTTVTLKVVYSKNNSEPSGGLSVIFKLGSTSGGQGTFSSVTDDQNGTYTAAFTGTLSGTNTIKAFIDGKQVTSAAAITVIKGSLSLAKSTLIVSSASVSAGNKVTMTLQPEDAEGNKLNLSGLEIAFALGNGSGEGTFSAVTQNKNGTYTATFNGTLAGTNTIVATIFGQALTSNSPSIRVTPGQVSLSNSVVSVSQGTVEEGSSITATLLAKDAFGNIVTTAQAVTFELASATDAKGIFGTVTNDENGSYSATFTGTVPGTNILIATLNGHKVTSTARAITVTPLL